MKGKHGIIPELFCLLNRLCAALVFLWFLGMASPIVAFAANNPYLVKDINLSQSQSNSFPTGFVASGGNIFFIANHGLNGSQSSQLWKTDGSTVGTVMVKDIKPEGDPYIGNMLDVNGTLFFTAHGTEGSGLWKSDGTSGGTIIVSSTAGRYLTELNSTLYFTVAMPSQASGLWKSDGTPEGTVLVKSPDLYSHAELGPLTNVNGILFFRAYDSFYGYELWKSDGTPEGTVMVKDIDPGGNSYPQYLIDAEGLLFFSAYDSVNGCGVWQSDGTADGTVLLKAVCPESLTNVNGTVFFVVNSYGVNQLWKSDGTPGGTVLIKDFYAIGYIYTYHLTALNGTLYFTVVGSVSGETLWKSDGTADNTVMVKEINQGGPSVIDNLAIVDNRLFFTAGDGSHYPKLWKSDGTPEGTAPVADIDLWGVQLASLDGTLFFAADDGSHGYELWISDGTASGTVMIKDINTTNSGSEITWLTQVNDTLFFVADDGIHGRELWKSDGSEVGTSMVKELNESTEFLYPGNLQNVGNKLFFTATDGLYSGELWVSDGTPEGTIMLHGFNPVDPFVTHPFSGYFAGLNNNLFFSADNGINGGELWKSDGTPEGTALVKDINLGGHSWPIFLTAVNNSVFFIPSGYNFYSLWKSDGTESGTIMVKDFSTYGNRLFVDYPVSVAGNLLFVMDNDLWKSDGTPLGTVKVKKLNPCGGAMPYRLTDVNGMLFYSALTDTCEYGLWKSDGTSAGTVLVADMSSLGAYDPSDLTAVGELVLFTATGGQGRDLWRTDGTLQGTYILREHIGEINNPTVLFGSLYFLHTYWSVDCLVTTVQLWRSDGTLSGTDMISSYCSDGFDGLASAGGRLFFTASDPIHGQELWAYDPGPHYSLAIEISGSGSGSIASEPEGINCGAHCMEWFSSGETVTLTATPSNNSYFNGWSGCTVDESNPLRCVVAMNSSKSCSASFDACTYTLLPGAVFFDASAGSGTFSVTVQTDCAWNAESSNPSWLSITNPYGGSGTGSGNVAYEVTENTNVPMRTAFISVGDKTFIVTQNGIAPPAADFSASQLTGAAPLYVEFTDSSSNNPASWSWNFGDGGSSTQKNPSHTYRTSGTYTVSLTVTNLSGLDTKTVTDYITITDCSQLPIQIATNYFPSLTDVYGSPHLIDGCTIKMQAREFVGNLTHDQEKTVTLKGGYDCGYENFIPETMINGLVTIVKGTIIVDGIVVR